MTRRAFLATPLAVLGTAKTATAASIQLTGRLDATESERTENTCNFGKAFAWFVNDQALWDRLSPMLGGEVVIHISQP